MKFTISTQELNYLINKIQNVVSLKPTMPILANLLIEAFNDELILTATDLTVSIRCFTEATILEEGATTLPAKRLSRLLAELTAPTLTISSDTNEVTHIKSGTSHFKINGMNKKEFPNLPDLTRSQIFTIPQKELKNLLYRTSFAASREDNRYVLAGILMQVSDLTVTFVGTDGKRLAKSSGSISSSAPFTSQSVIPLRAIEEISTNLLEEGEAIISVMGDKIGVEANQTLLITKLLSGDYPDISRVIPETHEVTLALHREELTSLLNQVSLFTTDTNQSVRFAFENGELELKANTMEIGEGQVSMPVDYQGPRLEIAFNPKFFRDILRHCKNETVTIGITDAYNPGLIVDGNPTTSIHQSDCFYVIMPMRLSDD